MEFETQSRETFVSTKKRTRNLIIAIVAILLVLSIATVVFAKNTIMYSLLSPDKIFVQAVKNTNQSFNVHNENAKKAFPGFKLNNSMPYHSNLVLEIAGLNVGEPEAEKMLKGANMTLDTMSDFGNRKERITLDAKAMGMTLELLKYYDDKNEIQLTIPMLTSKTYKAAIATFTEDYNNSAVSTLLGTKLPDDFSLSQYLDNAYKSAEKSIKMQNETHDVSTTDFFTEFMKTATFEKADAETVTINGKEQKLNVLKATLSPEDAQKLFNDQFKKSLEEAQKQYKAMGVNEMETSFTELAAAIDKMSFPEGFTVSLVIDKDYLVRVAKASTKMSAEGDDVTLNFDIVLDGETVNIDNVKANLAATADGETVVIAAENKGNLIPDKDKMSNDVFTMKLTVGKEEFLNLKVDSKKNANDKTQTIKGVVNVTAEGESAAINLDANLTSDDTEKQGVLNINKFNIGMDTSGSKLNIDLKGKWTQENVTPEKIEPLSKDAIEILKLDEEKLQAEFMEFYMNLGKLTQQLPAE